MVDGAIPRGTQAHDMGIIERAGRWICSKTVCRNDVKALRQREAEHEALLARIERVKQELVETVPGAGARSHAQSG